MARYHPILVILHWIMAIMILMAMVAGKFRLDAIPNSDPEKVDALFGHMTIGLMVGALLVLRLLVRLLSQKPAHATAGNKLLDLIGVATHWLFYALIALMVASGIGMAITGDLFATVYGGVEQPVSFGREPRMIHGMVTNVLGLLIILHLVAALYHQFILRDGLLRRMWFGKR